MESGSHEAKDRKRPGRQAVERNAAERIEYRKRARDALGSNGAIPRSTKLACGSGGRSGSAEGAGARVGKSEKPISRDGKLQGLICAERKRGGRAASKELIFVTINLV